MKIEGKIALVLGASRHLGRAVARELAQQGARLILPWYDWPEACQAMEAEFSPVMEANGKDRKHLCCQTDLRNAESVAELAQRIKEKWGRLDILINNIERGGMPIVHGSYHLPVNAEQWQREMETTLHAKWLVFEQSLPLLRQSPEAIVLNISSIAALTGRSGPAGLMFNDGYAAANQGISNLTKNWAKQGAPKIRVNEIMLGFFDGRHGPGTRGWDLLQAKEQQAILQHTLLRRTGTEKDLVKAIRFLLEDADFITGSTIRIDGGYVLGSDPVPELPPGILTEEKQD